MSDFHFPGPGTRVSFIGRTGSGKTQGATFFLSQADFHARPWIILDAKGDALLNSIPNLVEIEYGKLPEKPGIYILRILPDQEEQLSEFFYQCWAQENLGIFLDEGYMVGRANEGYNAILTQGRSKNISIYTLTQRPVNCSTFAFSEADYFCCFHLINPNDRKRVEEYSTLDLSKRLPDHHALWYDVKRDKQFTLKPVPSAQEILAIFEKRLPPEPPASWRKLFGM